MLRCAVSVHEVIWLISLAQFPVKICGDIVCLALRCFDVEVTSQEYALEYRIHGSRLIAFVTLLEVVPLACHHGSSSTRIDAHRAASRRGVFSLYIAILKVIYDSDSYDTEGSEACCSKPAGCTNLCDNAVCLGTQSDVAAVFVHVLNVSEGRERVFCIRKAASPETPLMHYTATQQAVSTVSERSA